MREKYRWWKKHLPFINELATTLLSPESLSLLIRQHNLVPLIDIPFFSAAAKDGGRKKKKGRRRKALIQFT